MNSMNYLLGYLFFRELKLGESSSVMPDSLRLRGLYSPWNFPGQNTEAGSPSLLHGIFSTQGLNPGFSHCRWIIYQQSHKASPRIPEWVAYPFSSGSSRSRDWTEFSYIAGGFFTNWAMREAQNKTKAVEIKENNNNKFRFLNRQDLSVYRWLSSCKKFTYNPKQHKQLL